MKITLRHLPIIILLALLLAGGIWVARFAWDRGHNIDQWAERVAVSMIENDPEFLSQVRPSLRDQAGNYDRKLTSRESLLKKNASLADGFLQEMAQIDTVDFTDRQRITHTLIRRSLQAAKQKAAFADYVFFLNPVDGPQVSLPGLFALHHEMTTQDEANHYLIRLRNVDESIEETIKVTREREAKGIHLPPSLIAAMRAQIARFLAIPPDQNPFYIGYARKLIKIEPTEINEYESANLLEQSSHVVEQEIYPAYTRLDEFLAQLPAREEPETGVWQWENGEKFYALMLEEAGIYGQKPADLHEKGQKSADSLALLLARALTLPHSEEKYPGKQLLAWSSAQPTSCVTGQIRYNPCLTAYQKLYRETRPMIGGIFENTESLASVSFIPAGEHDNTLPVSLQYFPSADSTLPDRLWIHPQMREKHKLYRNRSEIYRYLVPGDQFRQSLLTRQNDIPEFQKYQQYPAFAEGWALYADYIMDHDLNQYSGDSTGRIAYLEAQLRAAANLVADTGIHHEKWTTAQGKKYLMEKAGYSDEEADEMIQVILSHPGLVCSAWEGFSQLIHIRMYAEKILGNKFYLPEYHNALLFTGSAPVDVVTLEIRRLIEKKLAS
ncbi:MAG: DUF885 domain-containing protein [Bacteroidia bacterium]